MILYRKFLNEKMRKSTLRNNTLDEELFQNDLTDELTIENCNIVINLAVTLGVLENILPRKERSGNRSRETRKQIWEELYHQASEDEFV